MNKFERTKKMNKQKLIVGELVVIKSYSCSLRLGHDKCSNSGWYEPNARQKFKVLVTDCSMPTYRIDCLHRYADTIVMGQDDNIVWLVHSGSVHKCSPIHLITIDDKEIEISHESYLNIKKQFQD